MKRLETNDQSGSAATSSPATNSSATSQADSLAMNQGMQVLSYLISGVVLYGALGWVGDHFLHTHFLLPLGIIVGAALGIYLTIKRLTATAATEGER